MLEELTLAGHVTGTKQTRRALAAGQVKRLFLASDADPALTEPLAHMARDRALPVVREHTMAQLGAACGIAVGAAVCAVLI